jgi:hypothetical protein
MEHLKSFLEKVGMDNLERVIDESLIELKDQGFYHKIDNNKSSYTITIKHRGIKKPKHPRYEWSDDFIMDYNFRWGDIKETIATLIPYLQDIYPKLRFTEFKISSVKRMFKYKRNQDYPSVRSSGYSIGTTFHSFEELYNLDDDIRLDEIKISLILRLRGKIKPH